MTKAIASFLFLLFVGGIVLLPSFHRAHCAGHHGAHEAAQCPICQSANTPVITMVTHIEPIVESVIVSVVDLPQSLITSSLLRDPTQARAPPVA
ncbi:MAG: hypothetical protein PHW60_16055 [Kiritimatiellae bacterium]|nr:hypothetical protein [Kiritimatiellia bacterium]